MNKRKERYQRSSLWPPSDTRQEMEEQSAQSDPSPQQQQQLAKEPSDFFQIIKTVVKEDSGIRSDGIRAVT